MSQINHLEVILKVASRCNISCNYCYYYNGGDKKWRSQEKRMNFEVLSQLFNFIEQAIITSNIKSLQFDFHGGEPLLYGKTNFDNLCQTLIQRFSHLVNLKLAIQTNALLLDDEWIQLFSKYNVGVSVSLDGPKAANDSLRVDHKGKGTFDRALKGIHLLQKAQMQNDIIPISVLAVINPSVSGAAVYRYLAQELGIQSIDFLLPSTFNEEIPRADLEGITQYMLSVWEAWLKQNDTSIRIRFFDALFASLGGKQGYLFPSNDFSQNKSLALTVEPDGKLYGDDSLRANMGWKTFKPLNVFQHSFNDFISQQKTWYAKHIKLPSYCKGCTWANVCQGGQLEHRYRERNGFNNPSVYCQTIGELYNAVVSFLYINGMSMTKIRQLLL